MFKILRKKDNIPSILKQSFEEIKVIIADLPETISPFNSSFVVKQILEECDNSENFMLSVKSLLELRPVIFVELACCMPSLTIPENDNIRYENALRNQKEELIIRLTDKYNINDIRDETFIIRNDRGTNYEDTLFSNDNSISELFASNISDQFPILIKILKKSSVLRPIVNLLVEENTLYPIKLICKDHIPQ